MNKVFLAGRLASDPQQFVTQNGITQSRISIACADNWNKNEAYFFPCVAWQSTANFINTYLKKGDAVVVDGKLIRRSYISKEGKKVYIIEVVIETIKPFGSRRNVDSNDFVPSSKNVVDKTNNDSSDKEIQDLLQEFENNNFENGDFLENSSNNQDSDEIIDLDWMNDIN
ncbi:single-stranded DNA-binding protein [Malacoplasma muris]|uniref:single-stranded DNA-binding protein n=1 Tax=Malacoplasma muris TaxID=2119 RepID=UPI00398F8190